nr:hypothetical protein [Tanacetum cinerariifolium]
MRTHSSSNLPVGSPPNPSTSNPKRRNRRCSKQPFIQEESPVDTMADQQTIAELLLKSSDAISSSSSEIAKLTYAINQQTSAVTTAMRAILKQFQATAPPASIKVIEEICFTCGGAHPYYQCLVADGNTFPKLRDNIQGYVAAAAVNYNHGNSGYRPPGVANKIRPSAPTQQNPLSELEKVKRMNEANMKAMQTQINNVKNELRNEMKNSIQAFMSNQTNELKNMMASVFQMNTASTSGSEHLPRNTIANPKGELKAITTRSGIVLDVPFVPIPPPFINSEEDEGVEENLTDQDLAEYTIKVPPPLLHINITLADALILILKYQKMLKALISNKEKVLGLANIPLNENCSAVILKKLPEKLGDPGKFLILCGFSKLKCKALADLGTSINLMPLSVWKKLGLPELISTRMTLELANRAICTPAGIARDVFVPVGKFTFPADFVIIDYESDPRLPLILGRPFLWTARALIDVHGEERIFHDGDERLTLNMRHDTFRYSNQPQKESISMLNIFNDSSEDFLEDLFATNHQSGNPSFSSYPELTSPEVKDDIFDPEEGNEFADELALITFPMRNDDLPFGIEFDLKEIEYLLNHDPIKDMNSILEDSVNEDNLADLYDNLADTMPEMFSDEHALDYSSPPLYDEYDDDLFEVKSDTKYVYDDLFNSKGEKIKESKLLIDELDLPRSSDFLPSPKYDSFLLEDFFEVDALPLTNNEDMVFNPGILIQENLFEVITRVTPNKNVKKIAISHSSLILEEFDPPLYELPFFKEVPGSKTLLSFSFENEEKVFKPRILTSKGVHSSLIPELSHQGYKIFKILKILKSPMEIFHFSHGENIRILDVPCLAVVVFTQGDDLIAYFNKAMAFLLLCNKFKGGKDKVMLALAIKPKRPRNATWFKDKAILAEAQESGQILDEEQLAFLTDPGIPDNVSNIKAVLMANLSNYGLDVILEEETLILEEVSRSKMLAKQNDPILKEKKINTTPINYVELNQMFEDFGKRFVPQQEFSAKQAFWLQTSNPNTEQSDISPVRIKAPSKLPKKGNGGLNTQ